MSWDTTLHDGDAIGTSSQSSTSTSDSLRFMMSTADQSTDPVTTADESHVRGSSGAATLSGAPSGADSNIDR